MSDLTCPYCEATIDHDRADLWEYENEDEIECPECEKSFILLVEVTYEYTGRRHECQDGEHEYDEWVRMGLLCIIKFIMGRSRHMRRSCLKAIWTKTKCVKHWRTNWATRTT